MKKLAIGLLLCLIAVLVVSGGWLRFANPGLTETQLFLRFWWHYAMLVVLVLAALAVDILWKDK